MNLSTISGNIDPINRLNLLKLKLFLINGISKIINGTEI
jgi:hypothetical protein